MGAVWSDPPTGCGAGGLGRGLRLGRPVINGRGRRPADGCKATRGQNGSRLLSWIKPDIVEDGKMWFFNF